ncbi:MAG TPA: amidohydrolase [Actinocrinis sp.]|nr:amidohydrolase [Actinocrinis sp.]
MTVTLSRGEADPVDAVASRLDAFLAEGEAALIEFRRDVHAHPELGNTEFRTTQLIADRLLAAGLAPRVLPAGTGVICDIGQGEYGSGEYGPAGAHLPGERPAGRYGRLAIRADIDALPIQESGQLPFRSVNPGISHSCGHDVHTAVALGAGLFLAQEAHAGRLVRPVRLIFQPAEEIMPGGALTMVAAGALDGVGKIIGLHCDPRIDVGRIGLRVGPLTAACDKVAVTLAGPGGHTSRPHLTVDLVYALASLVTQLPAALSRRVDPRSGLSLVWGAINAGNAVNAIPQEGIIQGTVRCMDERAWAEAPDLIEELVRTVAETYGAKCQLDYVRGVPPVVNEEAAIEAMRAAAHRVVGPDAVVPVEQSLGGEDFSWYLQHVPGAMARLGVRTPGDAVVRDLHQPTFHADESAIAVGVRFFAQTALAG